MVRDSWASADNPVARVTLIRHALFNDLGVMLVTYDQLSYVSLSRKNDWLPEIIWDAGASGTSANSEHTIDINERSKLIKRAFFVMALFLCIAFARLLDSSLFLRYFKTLTSLWNSCFWTVLSISYSAFCISWTSTWVRVLCVQVAA